jgi:hypothetical protein
VRRLAGRIEKLERRSGPQDANRIIKFNPAEMTAEEALRTSGKSGGRYMLVRDYGNIDDWERAARRQQKALIASSISVAGGKSNVNRTSA